MLELSLLKLRGRQNDKEEREKGINNEQTNE